VWPVLWRKKKKHDESILFRTGETSKFEEARRNFHASAERREAA